METDTVVSYSSSAKAREVEVVESTLAPVVRTHAQLTEVLDGVSGVTKVGTSGFFNPLHKNHISNIISSKKLDTDFLKDLGFSTKVHLTVVVNGDWSTRQKLEGELFMPAEARADVVRAIQGVDLVFINDVHETHQAGLISLGVFDIFTKGGDRDFDSLPEEEQLAIVQTGTVLVGNVGFEKREGTAEEISSSKLREFARGQ